MKMSFHSCLIVLTLAITGCGNRDTRQTQTSGPSVAVSYESQPLADVEVSLHATSTGLAIAKAISTSDGRAYFTEVPSPEPAEYFVSLQSLSDGGWILNSKYSATNCGLRLKPLAINEQQKIELPRGAVRPLTPLQRR